jgi:hypothetical protein
MMYDLLIYYYYNICFFLFSAELCESCVLPTEFSSYSHPHLSACSALFCVISFLSVQFRKPFLFGCNLCTAFPFR